MGCITLGVGSVVFFSKVLIKEKEVTSCSSVEHLPTSGTVAPECFAAATRNATMVRIWAWVDLWISSFKLPRTDLALSRVTELWIIYQTSPRRMSRWSLDLVMARHLAQFFDCTVSYFCRYYLFRKTKVLIVFFMFQQSPYLIY